LTKQPFPRISTRGYFDLTTGKTIKSKGYYLYPKRAFSKLYGQKEIVIMIHGLRNDKADAVNKFEIAKRQLRKLGYLHPVVGFSYDANTKGAHLKKTELRALRAGQRIAQKNGQNLAKFLTDFRKRSPHTKFRLIGHSLGSQVIMSTVEHLAKKPQNYGLLESVHFFGASISANTPKSQKLQKVVRQKIVNCFSPTDEVLKYAHKDGSVRNPLGLFGASGKTISKYVQKRVRPKNHRFMSYAAVLTSFP